MRKIRDISEDEMIAIYLQTELSSVRFRQKLELHIEQEKIDTHIIQQPDWHNAAENVLRRMLLGVYRGYGQNTDYFPDFPAYVPGRGSDFQEKRWSGFDILIGSTGLTSQMAPAWRLMRAQCVGGKSGLRCEQRSTRVHGRCVATRGTVPTNYFGGEGC